MTAIPIIRSATTEDLPVIKQLFYELHTYNSSFDANFALDKHWESIFENHLCEPSLCQRVSILAEVSGQSVGLMLLKEHIEAPALHHFNRWIEVQALYVSPSHRRSGVGDALLAYARKWSQELKHDWMQLYVTENNQVAKQFYRNKGFLPTQEVWRKKL
jgi:ribosomal protein S18 acetylase RimI-like enzyme